MSRIQTHWSRYCSVMQFQTNILVFVTAVWQVRGEVECRIDAGAAKGTERYSKGVALELCDPGFL